MKKYECKRCRNEWNKEKEPERCPNCQSLNWKFPKIGEIYREFILKLGRKNDEERPEVYVKKHLKCNGIVKQDIYRRVDGKVPGVTKAKVAESIDKFCNCKFK